MAEWIVEMELAWTGFDCASGDNPLNTSIRTKWRPEIARHYEGRHPGRRRRPLPVDDLFVMHKVPFPPASATLRTSAATWPRWGRAAASIGAFTMPIEGGEASPCRVVAFVPEG